MRYEEMMQKRAKNVLNLQALSRLFSVGSTGWYLVVLGQYRVILVKSVSGLYAFEWYRAF